MKPLRSTFTPYSHARPLAEGTVALPDFPLEFIKSEPIISAYREMVRDLAYDICELAPTTYLLAREAGVPVIAIPVFTKRLFHHDAILCNATSGIRTPADLLGRKVGVRAYSVTTGVWVRGLLADDYDIDCDQIQWVTDDEEHVSSFVAPPNVSAAPNGASLIDLLAGGEIDAALTGNAGVGRKGAPKAGWTAEEPEPVTESDQPYSLLADPQSLERDWYSRTGIYPIHAVITIREDLVKQYPELPTQLYAAFAESKRQANSDRATLVAEKAAGAAMPADEDPVPYGIEPNARSLEALIRYAGQQHLLARPVTLDSIFADGDYPIA